MPLVLPSPLMAASLKEIEMEMGGDLQYNLNVPDPRKRQRIQSNAENSARMLQNLGAYFLELGRTMLQVQMGDSMSTATVNVGPPLYITDLGPNLRLVQPDEGLVIDNCSGIQQRQVSTEMIGGVDAGSVGTLREPISLLPRLLQHTELSFSVEERRDSIKIIPSHHQHEKCSSSISQQSNTELMIDVHASH